MTAIFVILLVALSTWKVYDLIFQTRKRAFSRGISQATTFFSLWMASYLEKQSKGRRKYLEPGKVPERCYNQTFKEIARWKADVGEDAIAQAIKQMVDLED